MRDPLFQPILINRLEVKNRIYMPAIHLGMAQDFEVTDQIVAFYAERARGGAGMITVGYATVDELSGNMQNIGAHDDRFLPGLGRLSAAIRQHGARSAVQLNHAGRYNLSFFLDGKSPVAPSAVPSRMTGETPRALTVQEIKDTVAAFARAAGRVKKAGFDAVEVLSGTGYLISEFLSPLTNQRTDDYGGSLAQRMRFGLEVMAAVRDEVGRDYPLIVRMNGNDLMQGGQGRGELVEYAKALTGQGVDALCINVGWHEARIPQIVTSVPRGVYAYLARGIKEAVSVPVIASHRINDPALARELLTQHACDMVAMARSLIADPELPRKAQEHREYEIVHCVACAQGCFDNLFKLQHIECLCNPRAGHEQEKAKDLLSAQPRKVLVVGGGAAGMSAAIAAADRGHAVTLCEKSDRLGGQLFLAGAPPGREEFVELALDLATQVRQRPIHLELGQEVTEQTLASQAPDAVILATGALPIRPKIPGAELACVVQSWDVLLHKTLTGKRVVVVGGGAVGVECALFLAEQGTLGGEALKFLLVNRVEDPETLYRLATRGSKQVTLVEMIDKLGKDLGKSTRWVMLQDLTRLGVTTHTATRVTAITESGVRVEKDGAELFFPADSVILAIGSAPHNPLQASAQKLGIAFQTVGDAQGVGLAFEAIHQGYAAGRAV